VTVGEHHPENVVLLEIDPKIKRHSQISGVTEDWLKIFDRQCP